MNLMIHATNAYLIFTNEDIWATMDQHQREAWLSLGKDSRSKILLGDQSFTKDTGKREANVHESQGTETDTGDCVQDEPDIIDANKSKTQSEPETSKPTKAGNVQASLSDSKTKPPSKPPIQKEIKVNNNIYRLVETHEADYHQGRTIHVTSYLNGNDIVRVVSLIEVQTEE